MVLGGYGAGATTRSFLRKQEPMGRDRGRSFLENSTSTAAGGTVDGSLCIEDGVG